MLSRDVRFIPTSRLNGKFLTNSEAQKPVGANYVTIPHLARVKDYLEQTLRSAPYDERYISLASTKAIRGLKDDPKFTSWRQHLKPGDVFYSGEVGLASDIRLIEITHPGLLAANAGCRGDLGEMIVFGNDPVSMREGTTPELRATFPTKSIGKGELAWHGLVTFLENPGLPESGGRIIYVTG